MKSFPRGSFNYSQNVQSKISKMLKSLCNSEVHVQEPFSTLPSSSPSLTPELNSVSTANSLKKKSMISKIFRELRVVFIIFETVLVFSVYFLIYGTVSCVQYSKRKFRPCTNEDTVRAQDNWIYPNLDEEDLQNNNNVPRIRVRKNCRRG